MNIFGMYISILTTTVQSTFGSVAILLLILGFFGLVIAGIATQMSELEVKMEGIWYCSELKMQISLSDPNGSFLTEEGERIRCRCNAFPVKYYYGMIELYCWEWEHPHYKHGKTLFSGKIKKFEEMSMVVYDRKSNRDYTFMRTDKVG